MVLLAFPLASLGATLSLTKDGPRTAREGDLVLIAGKGHEDYQIVGRDRKHFDDREEAALAASA